MWFASGAENRFHQLKLTHPSFWTNSCRLLDESSSSSSSSRIIIIINNSSARLRDPRLRNMLVGLEINCSMLWWARRRVQTQIQDWQPVLSHGVWRICWSQHASLNELRHFTAWLAPSCIKPICPTLVDGDGPPGDLFSDLLSRDAPEQFRVFEHDRGQGDAAQIQDNHSPDSCSPDLRSAQTFAAQVREFFHPSVPDDTLARLVDDDRTGTIEFANDIDNVTDEGLVQPQDRNNADDVPDVDDPSPCVDAVPADFQIQIASRELPRTRRLRGVPSAGSVATTVLDTSEDDVLLPLKRMRSQSPDSESVQSACADVIDLSPL